MTQLSNVERELVALGAALGSNCVPCIEYHVPEARKAGLTDEQILEAVRLADKVRQVPAEKVIARAFELLETVGGGRAVPGEAPKAKPAATGASCCG